MTSLAEHPHVPAVGEIAKDSKRNVLGMVMGSEGPYVQLRPLGGGREWDASPENITKADPHEILRAKTALENRRSRGEML